MVLFCIENNKEILLFGVIEAVETVKNGQYTWYT